MAACCQTVRLITKTDRTRPLKLCVFDISDIREPYSDTLNLVYFNMLSPIRLVILMNIILLIGCNENSIIIRIFTAPAAGRAYTKDKGEPYYSSNHTSNNYSDSNTLIFFLFVCYYTLIERVIIEIRVGGISTARFGTLKFL